jgi:hypothetical protein
MANLFNVSESPMETPTEIVVGDYLLWRRNFPDYSPSTYIATYVAKIAATSNEIQVSSTASDGNFLFTVNSSTSSNFIAGEYYWQLEISDGTNRIVIERGMWTIIADLDVNSADPRSHAEIMIKKIESILQGRADQDVASYSINGRSLTRMGVNDLIDWRDYYKAEVIKQKRDYRRKLGQATGSSIRVRF